MANDDELKEIYDLARRAISCQADFGHREIIFEKRDFPMPEMRAAAEDIKKTDDYMADLSAKTTPPDRHNQTSFMDTDLTDEEPEYSSLEEHEKAICNCTQCPLGKSRTNFVYGVGNPHADIMFIGEAPGRDEDLKGEPFVGRAGKLLDKILAAMKLSRDDVYIGNILKCRPPDNRDPQPEEMKACMPYLKEQIRLIKPKLICALGRIAAHGLLETTTPLGKLRGQWHRFQGIPLIVTYHPAALLRFQQYKRPTWEDMQELMAEYEKLK